MIALPPHDIAIDATGTYCPIPIIEAGRAIGSLSAGQVLLISATDPGAEGDFHAWCRATGHALVAIGWDGPTLRAAIRRKQETTP